MKGFLKTMTVLLVVAVFAVPVFAAAAASGSDDTDGFVSYYDQLDANGKAIFDTVNSADAVTNAVVVDLPVILTAKSDDPGAAEMYVSDLIENTISEAFAALRISSPLAYWVWTPTTVRPYTNLTVTGNTATVTSVSFSVSFVNYPLDPDTGMFQGIQKMLDDINAAVDKFSTDSTTVRGKVLDINNYINKLVTYDPNWGTDEESRYSHDVYGVFVDPKHYAVCDGYSKAFLLLCEKEGIECVVVLGTALPSLINHAWNYVKMDDGKWYAADVTWNDGNTNPYFLAGGDTFFSTHQQGVYLGKGLKAYPFNSPAISSTSYDSETPAWYAGYAWVLAIVIVALMSAALYRYAKGNG